MAIPAILESAHATREPYNTYGHPGWGVDIEQIFAIYSHAERGYPRLMCDLHDDRIRVDGKLSGMVRARTAAVKGRLALILPGGRDSDDIRAAAELRAAIEQHTDLHAYIDHAMTAPLKYGWGLSEQMWAWNAEERRYDVVDLHHVRSRNTRVATPAGASVSGALPEEILVQTGEHEHQVERQIPDKYIEIRATLEEPPIWAGLAIASTVWSTMKMQSAADSLVLLKRFGLPFLEVVVHDWGSDSDKQTARDIAANFGRDGAIVRPKNSKIEITIHDAIQMSRSSTSDIHIRFWEKCDAENAVIWMGSVLSTETGQGGASYALAVEQGNVAFRLTLDDARRIQYATETQWFARWMRFNGYRGRTPKLKIFVERIENPQVAVEIAAKLKEIGYAVSADQLLEMTGMRREERAGENDDVPAPEETSDAA